MATNAFFFDVFKHLLAGREGKSVDNNMRLRTDGEKPEQL